MHQPDSPEVIFGPPLLVGSAPPVPEGSAVGLGVKSALKDPQGAPFPWALPSPPIAPRPLKLHNPKGGEGELPPSPRAIPLTPTHTARLEKKPQTDLLMY